MVKKCYFFIKVAWQENSGQREDFFVCDQSALIHCQKYGENYGIAWNLRIHFLGNGCAVAMPRSCSKR